MRTPVTHSYIRAERTLNNRFLNLFFFLLLRCKVAKKSGDLNRDSMDRFSALFGAFGVRRSPRIWCRWKVFFLLSVFFHNYLSSVLDCPPTCSCSPMEIYCNKSDNSKFFPLLSFPGSGSAGNSTGSIEDLFQNITSM